MWPAGRWAWPGRVEHGPDDLAAVARRQGPEGAGDRCHDGESSSVFVKVCHSWARQIGAVVSDGQAQGTQVPGHGHVDIGAGMDDGVGHQLTDHQARGGNQWVQAPLQQGAGDKVACCPRRGRVGCESEPPDVRYWSREHSGYGSGHGRLDDQASAKRVGAKGLENVRVRARHGDRHPGPADNVPAGGRQYPQCRRLGALRYCRQIADDAAGPFGQRVLDRLVKFLDDIIERASELEEGYLTLGMRPR
jgi:hypothetical protein